MFFVLVAMPHGLRQKEVLDSKKLWMSWVTMDNKIPGIFPLHDNMNRLFLQFGDRVGDLEKSFLGRVGRMAMGRELKYN